jgi:hypothetical protein
MKVKNIIQGALAAVSGLAVVLAMPLAAHAASTVIVTSAHDDGWSKADTRPGGSVQFVYDPSSPSPDGALQLSTDSTTAAKAQYMHSANTALSDVTTLSYSTRQLAASFNNGTASYQLVVCLAGVSNTNCNGYTTLVYEPYNNNLNVNAGTWQTWNNVAAGQFWSSKTTSDTANPACTVTAGAGGAPFYTLADLTTNCPKAQVVGFGVNIGTYNTSYQINVDNIVFNDWTYDFQLTNPPTGKDSCKDNGYTTLTDENGGAFKNQGDCVSYTNGNVVHHMSLDSMAAKNSNKNPVYAKINDSGDQSQGAAAQSANQATTPAQNQ